VYLTDTALLHLLLDQPESVNITNVSKLFDADGKPHFKAVVEGANLFFTQQARLHLEKKGVIVFKDSSANKVSSGVCLTPVVSICN
jgi:NAD-specific glutamate dehydrogenase